MADEADTSIEGKLSAKRIMEADDLTTVFLENNTEMKAFDLYTLIGRAHNLRDGTGDYGDFTSLVGEFEAVRLKDKKVFYGPQCFVPGPAGELLVNQVRKFITEAIDVTSEEFKKKGKTYKVTGETVELALIVGLKKNNRPGGRVYEFTVKPIVDMRKADALADLRSKAEAKVLALAAPKKDGDPSDGSKSDAA